MSPIKVGIIGYGYSARSFHVPFIQLNPDLEIVAFLQRNDAPPVHGKPSSSCEEDFPQIKRYKAEEGFFGDSQIELVIVTSHHDSHGPYAEKAMRSGKNVVVEKPFVTSSEEADRLIAVQKETGKIMTVFHNRRYDSDFRTVQTILPHMGEVRECEIHYDWEITGWGPPSNKPYQPGDGMMFGLGSHTVDQALLLFGPPTSVTGFYRAMAGSTSNTDNWFTIILQYEGKDLFVTVKTMMGSYMRPNLKYFVRGTDGSFMKFGVDPQEEQVGNGMKLTDPQYGHESPDIYGQLTTRTQVSETQKDVGDLWSGKFPSESGNIGDYYKAVVKALRGEAEVAVKPEEARNGLRIFELARESADTGKTLPFN